MGILERKDFEKLWEGGTVKGVECVLELTISIVDFVIASNKAKDERIASLMNDIETLENKNILLENKIRILQLSKDP